MLLIELHYDEITLEMVAALAGLTVQTVIRHFGSREERRRPAVLALAMTTAPLPLSDTPPSAWCS